MLMCWLKCLILNYCIPFIFIIFTLSQLIPSVIHNLVLTKSTRKQSWRRNYYFADDICRVKSIWRREALHDEDQVTLVTQGSLDHLPNLLTLSDRWQGPISAAIYLPASHSHNDTVHKLIFDIIKCHHNLRHFVTVHLFHRARQKDTCNKTISSISLQRPKKKRCIALDAKLNELVKIGGSVRDSMYPVNTGRNLARQGALTSMVFVLDIELVPSFHLHSRFRNFMMSNKTSKQDRSQVYVFPAFEVNTEDVTRTGNARHLLAARNNGSAVPFHIYRAYNCHKINGLADWFARSVDSIQIEVLYSTKWVIPCWEPVFISHRDIPLYDERFRGYGKNKIQQVYEMCRANYTFNVMTGGFLVHRDISVMNESRWNNIKGSIHDNNRLFSVFQRELDVHYSRDSTTLGCDVDIHRFIKKNL